MPPAPHEKPPAASPRADGAASLTSVAQGCWRLQGVLNLTSVAALASSMPHPDETGRAELDLAGVERSSSAGVALLLEWQAGLQAKDASLHLYNVPESMLRLATLANVHSLLNLGPAETPGFAPMHAVAESATD
jgi:phospholipid transport system transporter-binding protein